MSQQQPWSPDSWKKRPAEQQPEYPCPEECDQVLERVQSYPPLVVVGEIEKLKEQIALAGVGKAFILQGGNCAERFIDCNEINIANKLKILLQMSVILTYGVRRPVVRIGRIAGQYAKPRSKPTEVVNGEEMPSYRGDAVNSVEPCLNARIPDPSRLESSYFHASATLNHIRALLDGGFADLHDPYRWNLDTIESSKRWHEYSHVVERIVDAIDFMESFGGVREEVLGRVDFYTSHEGLLLGYEQALTRLDPASNRYYNLGAHLVWIGMRTRELSGAHVEYFRGIANPIGVKVDPTCTPEQLLSLIGVLNPTNEPGRLVLITRFGAERVDRCLPALIQAVQQSKCVVTWVCDPMHGNCAQVQNGIKTRDFSLIVEELQRTFRAHKENNSCLAGVHFELTAENVTECMGGADDLSSEDLSRRYETYCDPRLNDSQSLEMAFLIAHWLQSA